MAIPYKPTSNEVEIIGLEKFQNEVISKLEAMQVGLHRLEAHLSLITEDECITENDYEDDIV